MTGAHKIQTTCKDNAILFRSFIVGDPMKQFRKGSSGIDETVTFLKKVLM